MLNLSEMILFSKNAKILKFKGKTTLFLQLLHQKCINVELLFSLQLYNGSYYFSYGFKNLKYTSLNACCPSAQHHSHFYSISKNQRAEVNISVESLIFIGQMFVDCQKCSGSWGCNSMGNRH